MIDYTASDKKEFTLKYGHKSSTFDYAMIYDEKKEKKRMNWYKKNQNMYLTHSFESTT